MPVIPSGFDGGHNVLRLLDGLELVQRRQQRTAVLLRGQKSVKLFDRHGLIHPAHLLSLPE